MNRPPASGQNIGHVDMLRAKQRALAAASSPAIVARIFGRPCFAKATQGSSCEALAKQGPRYRPVAHIMFTVARQADLSVECLRGSRQDRRHVDARSAVANLALEFCPRTSANAIDEATDRGQGYTRWARERHADRRELYPQYAVLFDRCRAELLR